MVFVLFELFPYTVSSRIGSNIGLNHRFVYALWPEFDPAP